MLPTEQARRMAFQEIEPKISKLQNKILQGVQDYFHHFGKNPRYRQLAKFLGKDRITVSSRLVELRSKGYIMSVYGSSKIKDGTVQVLTNKGAAKLKELNQ